MNSYTVTVGICAERDTSRQWFISQDASTPAEIKRAILRMAGKKYIQQFVERVSKIDKPTHRPL